jgi:signal peptidase I
MPQWWTEPALDGTRFYRGRSMKGTFRLGDRLRLELVTLDDVRPGDVVVYASDYKGHREELVHRVVAVTPKGLVPRGDNNPCPDAILVTADNLLGRVTHVERGGRTMSVAGGQRGLFHAWLWRSRVALWRWTKSVGRRPYRRLRSSGLVARLWQPPVRRVRIVTENGLVVKYVCDGHTVAEWWPQQNRFECQKPYDLVIPRPERAQGSFESRQEL